MASKLDDDADEEDVITHQFKVILLGDGAVGKTSIATRFAEDKFSQNYKQTVGVDFFIKRIFLQGMHASCVIDWRSADGIVLISLQPICRSPCRCGISAAR